MTWECSLPEAVPREMVCAKRLRIDEDETPKDRDEPPYQIIRFLFCPVDQFLARDAVANPWNGFEALDVDLLSTIEAFAKCAIIDPPQCRLDGGKQCAIPRFLS